MALVVQVSHRRRSSLISRWCSQRDSAAISQFPLAIAIFQLTLRVVRAVQNLDMGSAISNPGHFCCCSCCRTELLPVCAVVWASRPEFELVRQSLTILFVFSFLFFQTLQCFYRTVEILEIPNKWLVVLYHFRQQLFPSQVFNRISWFRLPSLVLTSQIHPFPNILSFLEC